MRTAIFGCSFASMTSNCGIPRYNMHGSPWMKVLKDKFHRNVSCFGQSGTSMYFSYNLFKKKYKNFNKIIFLGTYSDRKHSPNFKNTSDFTISYVEFPPEFISKEMHKLVKDYYAYIHNEQEANDMKELMIEDIKRLGGNSVLYIDVPTTIAQITAMENQVYDITGKYDHRWCHMSNENNVIFATQINKWLDGELFEFNLKDYKTPTFEELRSYYE